MVNPRRSHYSGAALPHSIIARLDTAGADQDPRPRQATRRAQANHVENQPGLPADGAGTMACTSGRALHVEGYEGKVVAVDLATDDLVASADTPEALMALLYGRS